MFTSYLHLWEYFTLNAEVLLKNPNSTLKTLIKETLVKKSLFHTNISICQWTKTYITIMPQLVVCHDLHRGYDQELLGERLQSQPSYSDL